MKFIDLDIPKTVKKDIDRDLKELFRRKDFILGEDTQTLEFAFANYIGTRFALGVNSGTDALFLGLKALGVGPGDEVILPTFTYIASAYAISYTGAKPVFVDINDTYCIDPTKIEKAITKKTKAIMPVHIYGQAANMTSICSLARENNLKVIEDCCQAHGANYYSERVGSIGDIGAFSFYPTKNLGGWGDGGIITTNNRTLHERLLKLRDFGRSKDGFDSLGYNSRLDSIQSVIILNKLSHLNEWNDLRRDHAAYYRELLENIEPPYETYYANHVYHIFAVRVKKRTKVIKRLREAGIPTAIHYPKPLHLQKVYKRLGYKAGDFPIAERVSKEILCLPMHPFLTKHQIRYVCKILNK